MAAELKHSLNLEAQLIQGKGGIYVVELEGKVIFDKKSIGRYPILGEVTKIIRDLYPEL
ncbi:MAG: hypothetical protein EXS14_06305 [Planctomycetes bacterium]|nr:hypothetical protein [Planctomycetota bacterium]